METPLVPVGTNSRPRFFYGWIITGLAGFLYFVQAGILQYGTGPINSFLLSNFGWSNSQIGLAFSTGTFFFFLTPIVGWLTTKFGPRVVLCLSGAVVAVILFFTAFVTKPWQFILTYGLILHFVSAFTATIPMYAIVNNWWEKRRGLNIGIVNGSGGLGSFVFVPLITWLLFSFGWQIALISLSVIVLVFSSIPQWILFRNHPEEKGQKIDNGVSKEKVSQEKSEGREYSASYLSPVDWDVKDAIRTYQLWFIMLAWCGVAWAFIVSTFYGFEFLKESGLPLGLVAVIQGSMGVLTIVGSVVTGFFVDRIGAKQMMIITMILNGAGITLLIISGSVIIAWMYAIVFGLATGMIIPCVAKIIPSYFGNKKYAAIQGSLMWLVTITGGVAPLLSGIVADATGSYVLVFLIGIGFCVIGLILCVFLKPPKIPEHYINNTQEA